MTELRTFTATIGRQNDSGFQIDERPGVWLNLSKFADPQPVIPPLGTTARITVDDKHFVRAIEPAPGDAPGGPISAPAAAPGRAPAPTASRDATITRLALIKAAARFLADKPDATSSDVTIVAEKWERWVGRGELEPNN